MKKKHEPGMAYNTKSLNKVFAFLSIVFLLSVFWVFLDDYLRDWKTYQVKALEIEREVLSQKLKELEDEIDPTKEQDLIGAMERGEKLIAERSEEITEVKKELAKAEARVYAEKLKGGNYNANVGYLTFEYETALAKGKSTAKSLKKRLDKYNALFAVNKDKVKAYESEVKDLEEKLRGLQEEKITAEKELERLTGARDRLKAAIDRTEIKPITFARNAPFVDYLDPTIKIEQIVLKNYTDDRYFRHTEKVDRCTTCHTFIDQPGYENQENPYKTHPKLDLMVGKTSKHPMKQFGCTNCHGGEGHRVDDFNAVAHMPQNKKQEAEWVEKYNWHEPHKVPEQMYRLQYTESQCLKCHEDLEYIPGTENLMAGKQLIETKGCYGCHKISGWEHMVKPGPSLERISSKVSKEWLKNWVWDPYQFNPKSRMPSFFTQVNNSKPEFMQKNMAEVNAIAEYLFDKAKPYKGKWAFKNGDAEKGKELISKVGCLGCHQVAGLEDEFMKSESQAGPYLVNLGSKLDKDWLVTWLIQPSHYQKDTIMPSFRLTVQEASNIAAFLLESRDKKFEQLKFEELNKELRDEMLVKYMSAFDTIEVAKNRLAKMSDRERTIELGRRSVSKYGCYSCHSVEGFDGNPPIGPELSNFGNKPLAQIGFGHEHDIAHQRDAWLVAHLEKPARWDVGTNKSFFDLNRMPNFYLKDKEIEKISTYLLGLRDVVIPMKGLHNLGANEKMAQEGAKVLTKYNCMGCHQIDGAGGEILKNYEDINDGPPRLVGHGERVQADWLYYFFGNVFPIRPYLGARMPSFNFSEKEKNALVAYFQHKSKSKTFLEPIEVVWEPGEKKAAMQLWENLACTSCHAGGFVKEDPLAPNLKLSKRKLRPEWVEKWLWDPQAILPGTLMPNFWEDGVPTEEDILGGDSKKQIRALRKLIYSFGYEKLPEPIEYLRDEEKNSRNVTSYIKEER